MTASSVAISNATILLATSAPPMTLPRAHPAPHIRQMMNGHRREEDIIFTPPPQFKILCREASYRPRQKQSISPTWSPPPQDDIVDFTRCRLHASPAGKPFRPPHACYLFYLPLIIRRKLFHRKEDGRRRQLAAAARRWAKIILLQSVAAYYVR